MTTHDHIRKARALANGCYTAVSSGSAQTEIEGEGATVVEALAALANHLAFAEAQLVAEIFEDGDVTP